MVESLHQEKSAGASGSEASEEIPDTMESTLTNLTTS